MFVPVKIVVEGGEKQIAVYDRAFRDLGVMAENMAVPLAEIGQLLETHVAAQFASQGHAGNRTWPALSPTYGAWKAKKAPGVPILVGLESGTRGTRKHPKRPQTYRISGRMRDQLLAPEALHVGRQRLLYAPDSDIAGFHETGTSKMPARPPVDLTPTALHAYDRVFARWIDRVTREAGL